VSIPNKKEQISTTLTQPTQDNNHIWPMYKNNAQRNGLTEYDTSENPGIERWKYFIDSSLGYTPVIDKNGILYAVAENQEIHAIYPNGSMKWKHGLIGFYGGNPAIGPDGTIYVGTNKHFHAFFPNGTIKWIFNNSNFFCGYPVVDPYGIVYVGTSDGYLYAITPNGTLKWEYKISSNIRAPALDKQGNVYFTARDRRLYCLSSNGSLKWKSEEITAFDYGPVIGDDGTIYVIPRWNWLFAFNPDGSEKWRTELSDSSGQPSFLPDGTIYIGGNYLYAVFSNNGTLKWRFNNPGFIHTSSPAISADGTIYFGTDSSPGYIYAVNPDGTEKWRKRIANKWVESSPSIAEDGTVYIGSSYDMSGGYLHAFGPQETNDPPTVPSITGPTEGKVDKEYDFTFKATDPDRNPVSFYIEWGDGTNTGWTMDYNTGEKATYSHTWSEKGNYTIRAKAKDTFGLEGDWATFDIGIIKKDKATNNMLFWRVIGQFPMLQKLFILIK